MDTQNNIYKSRARGLCSEIRKQRFLRDGFVVKASASQSVDQSLVIPKDFKKWYSQLLCLAISSKEIEWRTSRKACLLCPWARDLMGSSGGKQMVGPSSLPVVMAQSN